MKHSFTSTAHHHRLKYNDIAFYKIFLGVFQYPNHKTTIPLKKPILT